MTSHHIIIAEDDPQFQRLLSKTLNTLNAHVQAITDGRQVMQALMQMAPDLIILDYGLPNMDGAQILQHLQRHDPQHRIKIIMLTGNQQAEENPLVKMADAFFLKPVGIRELLDKVTELLAPASDSEAEA
jgi:DNA-binding response OmpR family regulator